VIYAFDEFELDDVRRTLRRGDGPVAIQARVFALLLHLIRHRGRVVARAELLREVWPDSTVSEAALSRAVKEARRAIGDDGERQRRLRTLHGEGFEFVGPVLVAGEPATPPEREARPAHVGRSALLAHLEARLAAALTGRGGMALLAGEPGLGKTRTAEELAERARRQGALVLWGRCWEGEGAPALWPWLQLVRARARMLGSDAFRAEAGTAAPALALLLPELEPALGAPLAPLGESEALRFRVFDGVTQLLRSVSEREPLLVVLDDLHCADAASLRLARHLARELDGARIFVLGTRRDREWAGAAGQSELLAALAREPGCEALALPPLDAAETAELARRLAAGPLPEPVTRALHDRTRGNPLFVGETLRHWLAEGLVDARGSAVPPERLPLGRGVRELIELRVATLGPASMRLLGAASVLGRRFPRELLEGLPALRRLELRHTLARALDAAVLRESEVEPGALEFSHALVQESLERGLHAPERAELHREAGETLEKLAGDEPEPYLERLAHHFLEAAAHGDPGKALLYARRAAERAAARGAYEEAAALLERARPLVERSDDEPELAELLVSLGEAHSRAGAFAQARASLASAAELAERCEQPELLARAALGLGTSGIGLADPFALDEAQVRLLEAAIAAQARAARRDPGLHSRLCARLALLRYWPSAEPGCAALADEAVVLARGSGDPQALAQALVAAYVTRIGPDRIDECPPLGRELERVANGGVSAELALLARCVQLRERLACGDRAGFDEQLAALDRETQALRQPQLRWWALVHASAVPVIEGRYDDALALAGEARALGERMGGWSVAGTFAGQAFCVALDRGHPERAEPAMRQLASERPGAAIFACAVALIEAETGRLDEARRSLAPFAAAGFTNVRRDFAWWSNLCYLAEVAHRVGDAASAALLERALAPFAELHAVYGVATLFYTGPVARYLGLLAHTRGDLAAATAQFERAAAQAAALGARPTVARIQADHAAVRFDAGDAPHARALAAAAAEAAESLGMARLLTRARALAG
jgi:DNA-binding winged helix-turn-helix (wHTH) protein/tetratricopeptide (TPR) repeat protein